MFSCSFYYYLGKIKSGWHRNHFEDCATAWYATSGDDPIGDLCLKCGNICEAHADPACSSIAEGIRLFQDKIEANDPNAKDLASCVLVSIYMW
jgi:hypothetical protein